MANWELQLIRSIIDTKDLRKAIKAGISSEVFGTVEARASFDWLLGYSLRPEHHGEVASIQLFNDSFRTIELPTPLQTTRALVEKVKEDHLNRKLHELLASAMSGENGVDTNPYGCLAELSDKVRSLHATAAASVKCMDFAEEAHDVLTLKYNTAQAAGGVIGTPWPWPEFTAKIGGMEASSMNLLIGIPKAGKTWIALYVVAKMWELYNRRVLIFSREMSTEQLYARLACILTGLNYEKWRSAAFTPEEHRMFFGVLAAFKEDRASDFERRRIVVTKGLTNNTAQSLETLRALIDDLEPDIVFLDSAYQMSEDRDWKTLAKLTSGVMGIVSDTPVAALVTIQDNERKVRDGKQGRGTSTVAMTPTWIQDCHLAIKVINNDNGYVSLQPIAGREGAFRSAGCRINFKPAEDMSFLDWKPEKLSDDEGDPNQPTVATPQPGRIFNTPPVRSGTTVLR